MTAFEDELEIFRTEEAAQQYFIASSVQTLPAELPCVGQSHGRSANSGIMQFCR